MVTKPVAAYQLPAGWIVIPNHGRPRRISPARCEGAPRMMVHWVGIDERTVYSATDQVTVEDNQ